MIDSYEANDEPMYMRFGRPATPIVYDEIPETLGNGVDVLREGKDITPDRHRPHGLARARGRRVARVARTGSRPRWSTSRSSSRSPRRRSSSRSSKTGVAVTAEEHRVAGGLADAVRTVAAEQHPVPIFAVGMGDEFGLSGTGEACMEHFGLTASGIADRAREALLLKPIVSRPPLFGPEWT